MFIPFKTEFQSYEDDVIRASQEVRDEVSLSSLQAQKQENELHARERWLANTHRGKVVKILDGFQKKDQEKEKQRRLDLNRRNLEIKKLAALDTLSTYDNQKAYRLVRKECIPGTSTWVCEIPEFSTWITGRSKTLWFTGKRKYKLLPNTPASLKRITVGSGKSVTRFGLPSVFVAKLD